VSSVGTSSNEPKNVPTIHATADAAPSGATIHTGPFHGAPTNVTFAGVLSPGRPVVPTEQVGVNVAFSAVAQVTTQHGHRCRLHSGGLGCRPDLPVPALRLSGVVIRDGDAPPAALRGDVITATGMRQCEIGSCACTATAIVTG
jgi:hypothetical protein